MLRRKRNSLTSGNCTLRDEKELWFSGRRDGLAMLRRRRNSSTSGNCTLRDEKESMVFWAKRWSSCAALEGEQLDEWQLYVEGRERSNGSLLGYEMVCLCCVGRGTA
jgi:hypothetical protein